MNIKVLFGLLISVSYVTTNLVFSCNILQNENYLLDTFDMNNKNTVKHFKENDSFITNQYNNLYDTFSLNDTIGVIVNDLQKNNNIDNTKEINKVIDSNNNLYIKVDGVVNDSQKKSNTDNTQEINEAIDLNRNLYIKVNTVINDLQKKSNIKRRNRVANSNNNRNYSPFSQNSDTTTCDNTKFSSNVTPEKNDNQNISRENIIKVNKKCKYNYYDNNKLDNRDINKKTINILKNSYTNNNADVFLLESKNSINNCKSKINHKNKKVNIKDVNRLLRITDIFKSNYQNKNTNILTNIKSIINTKTKYNNEKTGNNNNEVENSRSLHIEKKLKNSKSLYIKKKVLVYPGHTLQDRSTKDICLNKNNFNLSLDEKNKIINNVNNFLTGNIKTYEKKYRDISNNKTITLSDYIMEMKNLYSYIEYNNSYNIKKQYYEECENLCRIYGIKDCISLLNKYFNTIYIYKKTIIENIQKLSCNHDKFQNQ